MGATNARGTRKAPARSYFGWRFGVAITPRGFLETKAMNGYEPKPPQGDTFRAHFFREMQEQAFRSRRVLITPDTLTHQTTAGVFHRPKVFETGFSEESTLEDTVLPFAVMYTCPNGLNHDGTRFTGQVVTTVAQNSRCRIATGDDYLQFEQERSSDPFGDLGWPFGSGTIVKLDVPAQEGWYLVMLLQSNIMGNGSLPQNAKDFDPEWPFVCLGASFLSGPVNAGGALTELGGDFVFFPQPYTAFVAGAIRAGYNKILVSRTEPYVSSYIALTIGGTSRLTHQHYASICFPPGSDLVITGYAFKVAEDQEPLTF